MSRSPAPPPPADAQRQRGGRPTQAAGVARGRARSRRRRPGSRARPRPVELEPDPPRQPIGPVLGREQRLVELLEPPRRRRAAPATSSSPWPSAPAGRSAATASRRPSPSRAGEHPHRVDLVPVELAAEAPDGARRAGPGRARRARRPPTRTAASRRWAPRTRARAPQPRGSPGSISAAGRRPRARCPRSRSRGPARAGRRRGRGRPRAGARRELGTAQPNATRRRAKRATTARTAARVGGIRSAKPTMSVMNPGASSSAPPTMIIAPSKVSLAGTRPSVSARLKRSQAARPCERASAAPANPSRISSSERRRRRRSRRRPG